ncbi:CatB-related O-acetyltransferase [Staphylococcus gallinarum]|uniref:CatB-related O-acetyltransferase n=1 Tax=Staphylococcus gallinarum TaxID=1293 RepID=UPI001E419A71|nr:CatB-related O-acetyltransferase [Staphylococcus gallinarum]MCD8843900.1 CatB-related O-acetyltransferase [Staphylococcus gallinarum]
MIRKVISQLFKTNYKSKANNVRLNKFSYVTNSKFLGNNYIDRFCRIRNTTLGKFSYVGYNSDFNNVEVGNYCSISSNVKIGLGKHPVHYFSTSPVFYSNKNPFRLKINKKTFDDSPKRTIIKNDVWIGTDVLIMDGIQIGNGAVIASGSVVTKNVGDYEIVGGVPAKLIKMRFDNETRKQLLKSKWWTREAKDIIESNFFEK